MMKCFGLFLLMFYCFITEGQVIDGYKNDTLVINRKDTVFLLDTTFRHVSRRLGGSQNPVVNNKYEMSRVLGIKEEAGGPVLIVQPFRDKKKASFNYYIELFPAMRKKEIRLK